MSDTDVLEELGAAIDKAASVPLWTLPKAEVGEFVCRLQGLRSKFDALMAASTVEAQDAIVHLAAGHRRLPGYVAHETNVDPRVVAHDAAVGHWLKRFPVFAEASRAGVLSRRHVQALRKADNPRTHMHMVRCQDMLVDAAVHCGWREFTEVLRYFELAADPDGIEPKEQARRRNCTARPADGMIKGGFELDPLAGTALMTALDQEVDRMKREATERGEEADLPTPSQLRADALVRLVARGATREDGTLPAPLVHIVMSQNVATDTLARIAAGSRLDPDARHALMAMGIDPDRLPIAHGDIDARCDLIDGTPIHPRLATAALSSATLRRLVMVSPSESLDLGRSVRSFPRHLKDVLLVLARGRCEIPGCDSPFAWLEADHLIPWSRNGPTSTRNGGIKCRPDNMTKGNQLPP